MIWIPMNGSMPAKIALSVTCFGETPYRNEAMLGAIAAALHPGTQVCIAADLTLPSETIARHSARDWKTRDHTQFSKRPALFVLQA